VIAALYVSATGSYQGIPGVDPWDEQRDARSYKGPYPVVAHPPCQRWGKLWAGQPLYIKQTGIRKKKGDDGGCFEAALNAVRTYGGVLEHPEHSHAWAHFGLTKPPRNGGWVPADEHGAFTCCIEQGKYGHYARKPTWLIAVGCDLPELKWGRTSWTPHPDTVARMGLARAKRLGEVAAVGGGRDSKHRIGTPPELRDVLINMARSANVDPLSDPNSYKGM
jgi:hypothetical protein